MPRVVSAINYYKEETQQPYAVIANGQLWGGVTASAFPLADVIYGLKGTDIGFAGKGVIAGYNGQKVEDWARPRGTRHNNLRYSVFGGPYQSGPRCLSAWCRPVVPVGIRTIPDRR